MVARTPHLNSLKRGFLSQIHQPLPLSQREARRLLESITTSFRKNLDREHPSEADEASTNTPAKLPTPDSVENYHPTDRHLRAILSNPLFAHPRNADVNTPSVLTIRNDHFSVFDSAVSKGLMTPKRAAGFLVTVRSQLSSEHPEDIRQRMSVSGAGLRVLRWLRASGKENNLDFLNESALVRVLVPFLYAEGMQEVVWTWLARLSSPTTPLEFEINAHALSELMTAVISEGIKPGSQFPTNLDESYATLAKANSMLPSQSPVTTFVVKKPWIRLSWASTVYALGRPKPSVTRFEEFVEMGRPLNVPLDLAHLDLHHPTTPTHTAAVEYLRLRPQLVKDVSDMKPWAQQRVLCLVLDAAERLKQTGKAAEEPWVERLRAAIYEKLNLGVLNLRWGDSVNSSTPIRNGP
ncbi:hypothetical protein F4861DRAFT_146253 [Xylaria intraflava]|nr:hypothetical protein F4861DRAFT_146253 [Xylaria intraflava]